MVRQVKVVSPSITHKRGESKKKDKAIKYANMETNNFDSGSEPGIDIICNMIYVFPLEYYTIMEVFEEESLDKELAIHKPLYYYVINDNSVNEDHAIFERPDKAMQ